ncbi:MAG: chorismate synthase [Pirellulales bacterium]
MSKHTTQRKESDAVQVLSGVMPRDDQPDVLITTGTLISLLIWNEDHDQRSV